MNTYVESFFYSHYNFFLDVEAELPVQANRETAPEEVPELDRNILSIIGDDIPQTKLMGPPLQKDIAMRWTTILKNGLKEGEKENLVTKYPPVENCPLIEAPKLNLEVVSALSDTVVKRDSRLEGLQTQVGAALSALSQALTDLLREVDDRPLALIEKISDASRLLLDLHHQKTVSRREIVSLNLKKELKETLTNVQVDGWLFGDNLGERVKASKEIERSAQELKGQSKFKPKRLIVRTQSNTLNYRRPPQQGYTRGQQGGRKQYHLTPNKRQPAKVLEKKKQQRRESSRGYQSKQHHRYQ